MKEKGIKWNGVEDGLPTDYKDKLIVLKGGRIVTAFYDRITELWAIIVTINYPSVVCTAVKSTNVLYWAELPELPEELI